MPTAVGRDIADSAILNIIMTDWSEFLATDTEFSGSIPGATRFSE